MSDQLTILPLEFGGEAEAWLRGEGIALDGVPRSGRWPSMPELLSVLETFPDAELEKESASPSRRELRLTRETGPEIETVSLWLREVADRDAWVVFSLHGNHHRLALEVLERLAGVCGPYVVISASEGVPVLIKHGIDLGDVAERAFGASPFAPQAFGVAAFENEPALRFLEDLEEEGIDGLRHALQDALAQRLSAEAGMRIVAAAQVVVAVFVDHGSMVLGERFAGLQMTTTFVTERERALALKGLRRVTAGNSDLRGLWEERSGGPAWTAEVQRLSVALKSTSPRGASARSAHSRLGARLGGSPAAQLLFALWCQEALWPLFSFFFRKAFDPPAWGLLHSVREAMWSEAMGGPKTRFDSAALSAIIDQVEFEDLSSEASAVIRLVDLLGAVATGNRLDAAIQSSEAVIESLLRHLDEHGSDVRNGTPPAVIAEIERQAVIVDELLDGMPPANMRLQRQAVRLFPLAH